jgi:hypothetical protein
MPVVTSLKSRPRTPSVSFAEELHTVASGPVVAPPPGTTPVILPPPEPPPVDLPGILDCLPPEDHAAFATRFIAEELDTRRCNGPVHLS